MSPSPAQAASAQASPVLLHTEPELMAALEERGLALSSVLGATGPDVSNAALSQLPTFSAVVNVLEEEIARAAQEDPLAGVDVARYSHRLFDKRFLRSSSARFQLAGVVNRLDRMLFDETSCGETRLIYRLAYDNGGDRASKLPMTIGLELEVPRPAEGCRAAAERWLEDPAWDVATRAERLRSEAGPLSPERVRVTTESARLVLNLQLVRWPATVRPDLGGHAEYLLRSFRPDVARVMQPEGLENTIDAAVFADPRRRRELMSALESQRAKVDAGTPLLPDALLARRSFSVTPRGLSRLANRPFSAALPLSALEHWDYSQAQYAKSPLGLLRRLDQLSCAGCHQARSIAGFHLLGTDPAQAPAENSLAVGVSPHVLDDMERRQLFVRRVLNGEEPERSVPFAEHANAAPSSYGERCSLNDDPSFQAWKCADGLVCSAIEASKGEPIGQCLPQSPEVGDACERGSVAAKPDRRRVRMQSVSLESCGDMICNRSGVGFPGGMCTADCGDDGTVCGPIAVLDSFNACLARGESFLTCIRGNVNPAGLRACDAEHSCRDDYVCARGAVGKAAVGEAQVGETPVGKTPLGEIERGVCLPPYFVFQLRVDGHSSR
jgi:hypothetical protein